ncbi:MAG: protein TolQ [Betaproteobacteria bacterium]|nr:protein TolQ [Betaproteobacteria bacterium]MDE2424187.1 protein TolQ [Betaproteobacteria bacterium]
MSVTTDISLMSLVTNASILVQVVMALLLIASLFSWTSIFRKMFMLKRAKQETTLFEDEFWAAKDLNALYQRVSADRYSGSLDKIFEAGFREFMRHVKAGYADPAMVTSSVGRAMKATFQREMDALEYGLAFLASVGSVSPYVGLFGTVWGIMNAFRGLSNVGQATLANVAPGISEALVTTAMGLFAAIPAVIAYNRYAHEVDRLAIRFESFMEEFSNILQRQIQQGK